MSTAVSTGGLGWFGCVPNRPGKQIASCVAVKRWDMQSGGAAWATATALIAITAAAIDVLTVRTIVRMIVRMGVSPALLHYARPATVAEVSSRPGGFVPAIIVTDSDQHPLRLDVIFG
jgi:hypothetical protein